MVSLNSALTRTLCELGVHGQVRMHGGGCSGCRGTRTGGMGARAASRLSAWAALAAAFLRLADFELIFFAVFFAIQPCLPLDDTRT